MKKIIALLIFAILPSLAFAAPGEGETGMLFGGNHAFFVSATPGWVLDNKSGIKQGIHMLFYPAGETWEETPVIVYGKSVSRSLAPTAADQVSITIEQFRSNGSPDYGIDLQKRFRLEDGKMASIYYFSGDQWGNYEAAAYIEEVETINFLVFNARTKESFDKYIEDFKEMVKTYRNAYTPAGLLSETGADALILEAKEQLEAPGGGEYETKLVEAAGQEIANHIMQCVSYVQSEKMSEFHLFIRINEDGSASELMVYPSSALSVCFKGMMAGVKHLPHSFESFLVDLNMTFTE